MCVYMLAKILPKLYTSLTLVNKCMYIHIQPFIIGNAFAGALFLKICRNIIYASEKPNEIDYINRTRTYEF